MGRSEVERTTDANAMFTRILMISNVFRFFFVLSIAGSNLYLKLSHQELKLKLVPNFIEWKSLF